MKVIVTFNRRDDIDVDFRSRILGTCLTNLECQKAYWGPGSRTLTYRTTRSAYEIIRDWEDEGFNIHEFDMFCFEAD